MRSLGFRSKRWNNIGDGETFTMFRFGFEGEGHMRKQNSDGEWEVGEKVQIVSHPHSYEKSKRGERMAIGTAEIAGKSAVWAGSTPLSKYGGEEIITNLTRADAVANGFDGVTKMRKWIKNRYGGLADKNPIYKLTLKKIGGKMKRR